MKMWQIENSETWEISRKSQIYYFEFSRFQVFESAWKPKSKNLTLKKFAKKISEIFEISEVLPFPISTKSPQLEIR